MKKPIQAREIVIVVGKTGMGKTQYTKRMVYGAKRVIVIDPMMEYDRAIAFDELDDLVDHVTQYGVFRARYCDPRDLDALSFLSYHLGATTLVIEECQRVIPPRSVLPESLDDIIYRGRHTATSLVLVAQRAATVHIALRSQQTRIVAFRQTEKRDIDWLEDSCGHELGHMLPTLEPLEYLEITPEAVDRKKFTNFVK